MIPEAAVAPLLLAGMAAFAVPALWISAWYPDLRRRRATRDQAQYWAGWRDGRSTKKRTDAD